jgi:hypothetical protein
MIEFIVGLIAVVALFAAMLQIASLTRAQTEATVDARREAAERAMNPLGAIGAPDYVIDILAGDDESPYSVDDERTVGDVSRFTAVTVQRSAPTADAWDLIDAVPDNQFSAMHSPGVPMLEFQMVRGAASRTVPVMGTVRHLIYDAETIEIDSEVWMPWLRGIY